MPSLTKFKFGNRNCADSLKKVIIPTELGGGRVNIHTDVISKDMPLLLRKNAMKKVQALLDFKNDSILIFGQKNLLLFTNSWLLLYTTK